LKSWTEQNPTMQIELGTTWKDIPVKGNVIDKFSAKALDSVKVTLYEMKDGAWSVYKTTYTDKDGNFDFVLDHKGDYKLDLDKNQYNHKEFIIPNVENSDDFKIFLDGINPFTMEPEIKKGNKFKVDNIYFAFAKSDPLPESYPILDNIVTFLQENPQARIELGAHTDCVGKDENNMKLSKARAKAAVDYLVSKGISSDRLESQGYGETQILNGCYQEGKCSTEENQVNRRVEVKVL
jgi:outer membrane protein OmpA-like peptidoglycan-associated protein